MKKIITLIRKYLGEVMIIVGTGIFVYNIFNFSYVATMGTCLPALGCSEIQGVAYYYSSDILLLITIGSILMITGILIIRNKKSKID